MEFDAQERKRQRQEQAQRRARQRKKMLIRLGIAAGILVLCGILLWVWIHGKLVLCRHAVQEIGKYFRAKGERQDRAAHA